MVFCWRELTQAPYERIAPYLPVQRGNVSHANLQVLDAILDVAEHGCTWRGLPTRFGNWHTIHTRMHRWSQNGVLARVCEHLRREWSVRLKLEALALDSTTVKMHPDGTGALKKTAPHPSLASVLGYEPVGPPLRIRVEPWEYDREMDKRRHASARLFRRWQGFRRIFSRFEKLDMVFLGFIVFALIVDALR